MDLDQGWWILGLSQPGILPEDGLRMSGSGYSPSHPQQTMYLLITPPSGRVYCAAGKSAL